MAPIEIAALKIAVSPALSLGHGRKVEPENGEIDLGLAELDAQKNAVARSHYIRMGTLERLSKNRILPSMAGFIYICEYFGITPQEFFNAASPVPQKSKKVLAELEKLTGSQADHVITIIRDIVGNKK